MRYLMALAVVVGLVLLLGSTASAHYDNSVWYTFNSSSCPGPEATVDPINVIFYNWGTHGRVENQVAHHAGWTDDGGSGQWFKDHGQCYFMHTQRASDGISSSRYHIRIRGQHEDAGLGWAASGDGHWEDIVDCDEGWGIDIGHAVRENTPTGSGFDWGRNQVAVAMGSGSNPHSYYFAWRGNTRSFKQCDEQYASSDGNVAWISVHQVNH